MAEKFPDNPFKPVTLNRLPYPVNTYPQPVARGVVWQADQTEVLAAHPFPLVVNQAVLPGLDQQTGLEKGISSHTVR